MTNLDQVKGRVRASIFPTRPCEKVAKRSAISMLQGRVGTGRDGFLHYSPLRARHGTKLLTRPYLTLLPLFAAASVGMLRLGYAPDGRSAAVMRSGRGMCSRKVAIAEIGAHAAVIRVAAEFGARSVKLASKHRIIIDGLTVITVLPQGRFV